MSPNNRTRPALDRMLSLYDTLSPWYGPWFYSVAVAKQQSDWKVVVVQFWPLKKDAGIARAVFWDYGNLRLFKGTLSHEAARDVFYRIADADELALPDQPVLSTPVAPNPEDCLHKFGHEHAPMSIGYSFTRFQFNLHSDRYVRPPFGLLVAPSLPLYPFASAAIADFCGIKLTTNNEVNQDFAVLLPDYRAKVSKLRISSTKLAVLCEWHNVDTSKFVGKLFCKAADTAIIRDFEGGTECPEFDVPAFPSQVSVAIVSSDGQLVDALSYFSDAAYSQPGIELELSAEDVQQLVLSGESERLEFKRELPKARHDIAVSVVAMANRHGGRILLGVDDEGAIVGFVAEKPEETIRSILRDWCVPPIEPQIKTLLDGQRQVVVISVSEGVDKPYWIKDRGVYIRSGSTNRIATRYELDQMYQGRASLRAFQ